MAEQVGLPITVGVARTKFLAKVASGVAKPDGLLLVPPERELAFLHPLPVERLWGVGRATAEKLHALDVRTVGQVAELAEAALCRSSAGPPAGTCTRWRTTATRAVVDVHRRRRSIGSQRALGRRERSAAEVDAILAGILDRLGRRLRAAHRVCRTVVLRLRFADFTRATRSHTLAEATAHTETILATARGLLVGGVADDRAARPDPARGVAGRAAGRPVRAAEPAVRRAQRPVARSHAGLGPGPFRRCVGHPGHPARPLPRPDRSTAAR